jgi:iron complex transport system substrate-binding protein
MHMKSITRRRPAVLTMVAAAALICLTTTACGPAAPASVASGAPSGGAVSVTDMSGSTISLPHPARRIVAVGSSSLDALATAEVPPVAISGAAWKGAAQLPQTFKSEIGSIKQLAQTADGVNAEEVAAVQPDLIFINLNGLNQRESLSKIAPVAVVDSGSDGLAGALQALEIVGTLTGHERQAQAAKKTFEDRLDQYKEALDKAGVKKKTVLVMSDATRNFRVATTTSSTCDLLNQLGSCPFEVAGQKKAYLSYSIESVRKINPEVIFIRDDADPSPDLAANPFWQDLNAVQNKEVFHVDHGLWVLGGTIALTKVLDEAMPKMYPDVFPHALPAT